MRKADLFNFLLEANLMACMAIVLLIIARKMLRKPLGSGPEDGPAGPLDGTPPPWRGGFDGRRGGC